MHKQKSTHQSLIDRKAQHIYECVKNIMYNWVYSRDAGLVQYLTVHVFHHMKRLKNIWNAWENVFFSSAIPTEDRGGRGNVGD